MQLNRNSIISLDNDFITKEKVEVNIQQTPQMLFLTATNQAAGLTNTMAVDILFLKQLPSANIIDSNKNARTFINIC